MIHSTTPNLKKKLRKLSVIDHPDPTNIWIFWGDSYSSSTMFLCPLSGPASARWPLPDPNTCVPHKPNPIIHLHLSSQEFTDNNNNQHQEKRIQLLCPVLAVYSSRINAAITNTVLFQNKQSRLWSTQLEQRHSVQDPPLPRPTTMNVCSLPASISLSLSCTVLPCSIIMHDAPAAKWCLCVYNT